MDKKGLPKKGPQKGADGKIRMKPGEILFSEGDASTSMYLLVSGMLRIYKSRGEAQVEIATIRSGQIIGELAFLDGQERSAGAEALTACVLVEVSTAGFSKTMQHIPEWLKALLKTVVGRLRAASSQIRQLEAVSTQMDYGKGVQVYTYLSMVDLMKVASAIILVALRHGTDDDDHKTKGYPIRISMLHRYAYNIYGIPIAKITSALELLGECEMLEVDDAEALTEVRLKNVDQFEKLVFYLNAENQLEPSKRHDLTTRGFVMMTLMYQHLNSGQMDENGNVTLNIAKIINDYKKANGKEPFFLNEFEEMVKLKYATSLDLKSGEEAYTQTKKDEFIRYYQFQRVIKTAEVLNKKKSAQHAKTKKSRMKAA